MQMRKRSKGLSNDSRNHCPIVTKALGRGQSPHVTGREQQQNGRTYMVFSGHTALITGAGQGIGRACAEVFATRGADLVLMERNAVTLGEVAESLSDKGVNITTIPIDLTDLEEIRKEISRLEGKKSVDILVNNVGFDRPGTIGRIDTDDFQAVVNIHLTVPFLLIKLLLPGMSKAGWGRIVNVSSV